MAGEDNSAELNPWVLEFFDGYAADPAEGGTRAACSDCGGTGKVLLLTATTRIAGQTRIAVTV